MPTYDYVCAACGHALEIFHAISEAPRRKCPACGKPKLERRIGAGAGFLFKGSGFYLTDYRSKAYTDAKKSESGEGGGAPADGKAAGETKAEKPAAPEAKPAAKPEAPKTAASEPGQKRKKDAG